jgi:drug/metabolite transporter (DMT)-like permease
MSHGQLAIAVAASAGAATAYGAASALQHEQAGQLPTHAALDPRLLTALSQRPRWLIGIGADIAAVSLQAVALRYGAVVLVQLILVAGLPVAVLLSALLAHRRPTRREVRGLLLCGAGLALAVPASSEAGLGVNTGAARWAAAAVVGSCVTAGLLLLARRRADLAPVLVGVAAGIAAGSASAVLAVCAAGADDMTGLLRTPAPYAMAVVGLVALLLTQAAFQTGAIAAPLAALSVVEPVVASILAVAVLSQRLPSSPAALAAGAAGVAAAAAGVLVLAGSWRGGAPHHSEDAS